MPFRPFWSATPRLSVLAITSPDRLYSGWKAAQSARVGGDPAATSAVESLLDALPRDAAIVSVIDGHPLTLGWLGAVQGNPIHPLGVETFGQSADLPDLYHLHGVDAAAIVAAARTAGRIRPR